MTAVLSLLPSPPPSLDFERCYCCNHRTETQTEERQTSTETAEAHEAKWTEPIRMNSSLGRRSRSESRLSNLRWVEVIDEDEAAFSVPTAFYKLTLGSLGGALTPPPAPAPIPPPKDTSSIPIPRTISRRDGETLSALVSSNVANQYMRN